MDTTKRPAFKSTLEKTLQSYRHGSHATVFDVRRDPELKNKDVIRDKKKPVFPFISGAVYRGEWHNDEKCGFGTQTNTGGSKYDGEFHANLYHGSGTLFVRRGNKRVKQYVGNWTYGKMNGFGTYFYENGDIYKGNWQDNKRLGQGKLEYLNGDYYEGEWANDLQRGFGTLYLANGNVFEGLFRDGLKDGPGRFFYAATKKVYEGEWVEDEPRCGEYREPKPDELLYEMANFRDPPISRETFPLPKIGLLDPQGTLDFAKTETRLMNATLKGLTHAPDADGLGYSQGPYSATSGSNANSPLRSPVGAGAPAQVSRDTMTRAKTVFSALELETAIRQGNEEGGSSDHTVPFALLGPVFDALLMGDDVDADAEAFPQQQLSEADLCAIMEQLEIEGTTPLSFPEVVEIAACIFSK